MMGHTRDIMGNISDLTLQGTQNFLATARVSARLTNNLIASNILNADKNGIKKLEQYFFDQLELYPQFAGIYLATPNGNFYYVSRNSSKSPDGYRTKIIRHGGSSRQTRLIWRDKNMKIILEEFDNNDTYDPRKRPWYIKAAQKKQIIWTDPYIFFTSRQPGITTAIPVYNAKKKIKAIVGVDIQLNVLSEFISRLKVGKTGLAFMINNNKEVIAFPDPAQLKYEDGKKSGSIRLPKISEINNKLCEKAYNSINWEKHKKDTLTNPVFSSFSFENKKYFTMFTKVPGPKLSWMIGLFIPEDDYFSEINKNQKKNQALSLIISIFATIAGLIMATSITRPISELDCEVQSIKNNNYRSMPKIKSNFVEIQRIISTFYGMKKAIISYKKELIKKEKIHKIITNTANDAIIMADKKGNIFYWNMAAENIFGYTKAEAAKKTIFSMIIPKKDHESAFARLSKFLSGDIKDSLKSNIEITTINKTGKKIPTEISIARIKIENSLYAIAIIRDITIRKQVEAEKINIIEKLKQSQKMESIGTLAGGIAHDFNNLLFPIMGNTEILMIETPDNNPLQENLEEIMAATTRASELAQQILTFARPKSYKAKSISLYPVIQEALKLFKSGLPEFIQLKQKLEKDCGMVKADPTSIHQIIMNLLTNAHHAMENNSKGTIIIELKKIMISEPDQIVPELKSGEYAFLSIADSGTGIDKNIIDKIFDPFFTTKGKGKGTGLGLSIVHGIVNSINGAIKVFSEPGQGTEFQIFLPLSKKPLETEKFQVNKVLKTGNEKILLIDDEESIIKMEKMMLERIGYTVTSFMDSNEALKAFSSAPENFDVVISDMSMPIMSGDILAKEIKKIRGDIPIILCTGFKDGISMQKTKTTEFTGILQKPVTMEKIAQKIREVLDG